MIFATVAIVCTMATCNDYFIDTAHNGLSGEINTVAHQQEFSRVWEDEKGLTSWLKKYKIQESIFEIVSIDLETHKVASKEIP